MLLDAVNSFTFGLVLGALSAFSRIVVGMFAGLHSPLLLFAPIVPLHRWDYGFMVYGSMMKLHHAHLYNPRLADSN